MKNNASNIDGFLKPTNARKRVTLDAPSAPEPQVRDGLLPVQNQNRNLGEPVELNTIDPNGDDWANDLTSTLADLPGYGDMNAEDFVERKKPSRIAMKRALQSAPKPKKKPGKKKKVLLAVLLSLILVVGAAVAAMHFLWPEDSFIGNWWEILSSDKLKEDSNGRTNILIFGTAPVDYDGPLLSDSIMVLSVNQTDNSAYMISLPRDLWVKHYCPNLALNTTAGRLNETYRCALEDDDDASALEEAAAAKEFQDKAGEITGLDVQYYVHLSWNGVIDIVDSLGGIDITIESDNPDGIYDVATGIDFENGEVVHMDGRLALAFIRARGAAGGYGLENSNFAREKHQRQVIQAIQSKASSAGTLLNPTAIAGSLQALGDNARTNFKVGEIRTLARLANGINTNNMISLPLADEGNGINLVTTDMINEASVVVPTAGTFDYREIKQYIREMMSSDPMVREKAVIDVLNGSGVAGMAAAEAGKLESAGFRTGYIGNAEEDDYGSVRIYQLAEDKSVTAEALRKLYNADLITENLPFYYHTDADFVVIVG